MTVHSATVRESVIWHPVEAHPTQETTNQALPEDRHEQRRVEVTRTEIDPIQLNGALKMATAALYSAGAELGSIAPGADELKKLTKINGQLSSVLTTLDLLNGANNRESLDCFESAAAHGTFLKGYAKYLATYEADIIAAGTGTGLRADLLRQIKESATALNERSFLLHGKEADKDAIADKYEARGREPPRWKRRADTLFNAEDVRVAFATLKDSGVIPAPDRDFVFVSASSNLPTHERTIFEEDQKSRQGKARFLSGDISQLEAPADLKSIQTANGSFQFFRWDAERLPIAPGSADLIWDRKGWLWHNATSFQKPERFIASLMSYAEALAPGGAIVIDAIPGWSKLKSAAYGSLAELDEADVREAAQRAKVAPQFEPSTVEQVDRMAWETGVDVWRIVAQHFDITDVGEGVSQMRVLRRRSE